MDEPADAAIIPDFLQFGIGAVEMLYGASHDAPSASVIADLFAEPDLRLVSEKQNLATCTGSLHVRPARNRQEWKASIRRSPSVFHRDAGFRTGDYSVDIEIPEDRFPAFLSLFATGLRPFGLLLDTQGIDWPDEEEGYWEGDIWDDVRYPHVRIPEYYLRWAAPGRPGLARYIWPSQREPA